ncbi:MAG: hypothetical protein K0R49_1125 [Burkholderiales bacterium]|nr:hypothetical protein [Burkholderiales bacterium]
MKNVLRPEIDIEFIIKNGPGYVYWKNIDSIYIGCNQNFATLIGLEEPSDIIGLHESDMPWSKINPVTVEHNIKADQTVLINHEKLVTEECLGIKNENGLPIILRSEKKPLIDQKGMIVGILGVSVDITDTKEKERLAIENKVHETTLEQQNKFRKIVDQVVHDIRSPIASMQMILPLCKMLPENLRVSLNKSAVRIVDVANNLLNKVKPEDVNSDGTISRAPALISSDILDIVTEKKYEYSKLPIDFITKISQSGHFVFINIDTKSFKRMLSNLINNAVDAYEGRSGEIVVHLDIVDNKVYISIQDNGKGMPLSVKEKILNSIAVTEGKQNGNGIGFGQIHDALANNEGTLEIETEVDSGTKVIITFPKIETPSWIAEKIDLYNDTLVVILDDDESIHGAWRARFKKSAPHLTCVHFKDGSMAITFINDLDAVAKSKVFLLTDYELLQQDLDGLDIISETGIKSSILVTSHHNNPEVRELAKRTNTKILPKPLAPDVPINIIGTSQLTNTEEDRGTKADVVFIDDDKEFANILKRVIAMENKVMHTYSKAQEFLNNISKYSADTIILVDNQFEQDVMDGQELAKKLHEQGFKRLYLFSGTDYSEDNSLPKYLTPILKTDIEFVRSLLRF